MRHKELTAVVEKAIKRLDSYAGTILAGSGTNEDIYQFRVTYKKLRAFLRLLYTGEEHNDPLKPLKKIYSLSGELRDLQIHLGLISGYVMKAGFHNAVYKSVLEDNIQEATDKLHEAIQDFSFHEFGDELADHLPNRLDDAKVIPFVHEKVEGFYANIKDEATDEQLHTARKHLKDIIYNAAYLRAGKKDALFLEQEEEVKKLATLLGDYHDKNIIIAQLRMVPEDKIPVEEWQSMQHFSEELHREKGLLKKNIIEALQKLLDKTGKSSLSAAAQTGLLLSGVLVSGLAVFFLNYMRRGD